MRSLFLLPGISVAETSVCLSVYLPIPQECCSISFSDPQCKSCGVRGGN